MSITDHRGDSKSGEELSKAISAYRDLADFGSDDGSAANEIGVELPLQLILKQIPEAFLEKGAQSEPNRNVFLNIPDLLVQLKKGRVTLSLSSLAGCLPATALRAEAFDDVTTLVTLPLSDVVKAVDPALLKSSAPSSKDVGGKYNLASLRDPFKRAKTPEVPPGTPVATPPPPSTPVAAVPPPPVPPPPPPPVAQVVVPPPVVAPPPPPPLPVPPTITPVIKSSEPVVPPPLKVNVPISAPPPLTVSPPVATVDVIKEPAPPAVVEVPLDIEPAKPVSIAPPRQIEPEPVVAEPTPEEPVVAATVAPQPVVTTPVPEPVLVSSVEEVVVEVIQEPEPVAAIVEAVVHIEAPVVVEPANVETPIEPVETLVDTAPVETQAEAPVVVEPPKPVPVAEPPATVVPKRDAPPPIRTPTFTGAQIPDYDVAPLAVHSDVETGALGSVNANTADADQLLVVPGMDLELANMIVGERLQRGPYQSIFDLCERAGISRAIFQKITGMPYSTQKKHRAIKLARKLAMPVSSICDVNAIAEAIGKTKGISGCVICDKEGLIVAEHSVGQAAEALSAIAADLIAQASRNMSMVGLTEMSSISISIGGQMFTIARSGELYLTVVHDANRITGSKLKLVHLAAVEMEWAFSRRVFVA